jgi:hypothetical protein
LAHALCTQCNARTKHRTEHCTVAPYENHASALYGNGSIPPLVFFSAWRFHFSPLFVTANVLSRRILAFQQKYMPETFIFRNT